MTDGATLEGWAPEIGPATPLEEIVDKAFDYRGNITVVKTDGSETVGYLFNRNRDVPVPFVQMFDLTGAGPYTIPYGEIRAIRFTGRDTAAGNSYAAWLRAKEAAKAATHSEKDSGGAPSRGA
ncbi:MAG: hypothetical protein DMD96_14950 [Candidatus Rokuibacteriota bacterium]|nr:MAG: hypothetical protein DMD96_14950 [Candidatus Rokubacteria bacterium]